jgi:3-oxoacyl-[acyl-carrier-protein] synthase II
VLAVIRGVANCFEPVVRGSKIEGTAVQRALRSVLRSADWKASDVGHVNAHGASSVHGDRVEAAAIQRELAEVPVTAPSSYFGSLGPGGGAVETLATLLGFVHDTVPATLNYQHPDATCPVNVVCDDPLPGMARRAVKLSYTTHGQAIALALAAPNEG